MLIGRSCIKVPHIAALMQKERIARAGYNKKYYLTEKQLIEFLNLLPVISLNIQEVVLCHAGLLKIGDVNKIHPISWFRFVFMTIYFIVKGAAILMPYSLCASAVNFQNSLYISQQ
jgi:hypothetical protein